MNNININVTVNQSGASARLKNLHSQIQRVGKATEDTAKSFKNFNRTIFGATAFVGLFTQAFSSLANTLMVGSDLDRAALQFQKRFGAELPSAMRQMQQGFDESIGPQGNFIRMLRQTTDNSIDVVTAMKSAIQLRSAGVSSSIGEITKIMAMAGTAGKNAGKDSAEGIRRVTDFLKDGSLAHLQHLGLLRESDPAYKAHLAILNKAGGTLGKAVTAQYKLTLGMKLLTAATRGQLKGQRDLRDTLQDTAQYFTILKSSIGTFIGKALQPLLEKFIDFSINMSFILEDIKNNKKEIMFLGKAFIIGTAAVAGFVLAIGGLRLAVTALTSLVGGIPFLTTALGALAAVVLYNKFKAKDFIDTLQNFGAVLKGTYQLVSSFFSSQENFSKGVGLMDSKLKAFLQARGLLTLTENISRVVAIIGEFSRGALQGFTQALDGIFAKLGPIGDKIKNMLGIDAGAWKRDWLKAANDIGKAFGKLAIGAIAFKGVASLLGAGKSVMGFGGRGKGPKGTSSDPLFVAMSQKIAGGTKGFLNAIMSSGSLAAQKSSETGAVNKQYMKQIWASSLAKKHSVNGLQFAGSAMGPFQQAKGGLLQKLPFILRAFVTQGLQVLKVFGKFSLIGVAIAAVGTALAGFVAGLWENRDKVINAFGSMTDYVVGMFSEGGALSAIGTGFKILGEGVTKLVDVIGKAFTYIYEKFKVFGSKAADSLSKMGDEARAKERERRTTVALNMIKSGSIAAPKLDATGYPIMPPMPDTEEKKMATAIAAFQSSYDDRTLAMSKVYQDAIKSTSPGGISITQEEWVDIYAAGLDKSKKMGELAKNTGDTTKNLGSDITKPTRAGAC